MDRLIEIILRLAVSLAVLTIGYLVFAQLIDWFKSREELVLADKDNIAFTLQQKLAAKKYKTVQGIFNRRTSTIVDGRNIVSDTIDAELAQYHRDEELVIYPH